MKRRKLKDILHEYLEKIESGEIATLDNWTLYQEHNETLYRMLETVLTFKSVALPSPTDQYKTASKNRIFYELMEEFEPERSMPVYTPTSRKTYRRPLGLQPIFTIVLVIVLSFGVLVGGAQAADNAGPGDFLYPVDLLLEDLRLALTPTAEGKLQLMMSFASERVAEADEQFALGHYEDGNLALAAYELQMDEIADLLNQSVAYDDELIQNMAELNSANQDVLELLLDKLPDEAKEAIEHAIDASDHTNNPNKPPAPPGLEDKDKDTTDNSDVQDEDKDEDKEDKAENVNQDVEEAKETKEAEKEDAQEDREFAKETQQAEKENLQETKDAEKEEKQDAKELEP